MSTNVTAREPIQELGNWDVLLSLTAATLIVTSVTCNVLLICVILKSRVLQTPTNLFIGSIAVSEIMNAVFAIPFAAASVVANKWPFSQTICHMSASLYMIGRTSSTYSVMAVCIDRCIAVSRPLRYSRVVSIKSVSVALLCIWMHSLIVSLLPLGTWGSYQYMDAFYLCIHVRNQHEQQHIAKEVICSFIPTFIISLSLLQIFRETKSHHRIFSIMPLPVAAASLTTTNIIPGIIPGPRGHNRNTARAMRSLYMMTFGYAVFCLPMSLLNVVHQSAPMYTPPIVITMVVWLSFLCCVLNSVIIISFNRKFRMQMRLLCSSFVSCPWCTSYPPKKEIFTVSSGLHAILEATIVLNVLKLENASTTRSTRRQILAAAVMPPQ